MVAWLPKCQSIRSLAATLLQLRAVSLLAPETREQAGLAHAPAARAAARAHRPARAALSYTAREYRTVLEYSLYIHGTPNFAPFFLIQSDTECSALATDSTSFCGSSLPQKKLLVCQKKNDPQIQCRVLSVGMVLRRPVATTPPASAEQISVQTHLTIPHAVILTVSRMAACRRVALEREGAQAAAPAAP